MAGASEDTAAQSATPKKPAEKPAEKSGGSGEKHSREYLVNHSQAFAGVPGWVLAGALADEEGDEFSPDQARSLAEKFREREVGPIEGTPQAEQRDAEEEESSK